MFGNSSHKNTSYLADSQVRRDLLNRQFIDPAHSLWYKNFRVSLVGPGEDTEEKIDG